MINLAVINLKDIIKFIKNIIISFIIGIIFLKLIFFLKNTDYVSIEDLQKNYFSGLISNKIIGKNILISNAFENTNTYLKKESSIKKVLMSELAIFNTEEELMELENQEEAIEFEDQNNNSETDVIEEENNEEIQVTNNENIESVLPTRVITKNNKTDTYTDIYKSVKIKNESKYTLTQEMVTPNVDFTNKKDIIIYHTHTCESYTPTEANNYVASGNFRTTDLNYSVAGVGTELTNNLKSLGFNVNHDTTYHDYPAYTGSYTRSLATIQNILQNKPNSQFVIDLHRDALGSNSNYGPTVQIGDEVGAQLMFVMGTDGGGLEHPNWLNNFKLAIKIQEKANEMYPGLFKPIILRDSRYNQHVTTGACIIEVGATGNTLEECKISMKYLAKVIEEVMK